MKTLRMREGDREAFIIADLDPAYHQAARDLQYTPVPQGFARIYPADAPHLEQAYRNFTLYAEPMILQTAQVMAVPWEEALHAFLERIAGESLNWWLTGSAALAVRGAPLVPRDFDLVVDEAGAKRLGYLLQSHLVEPVLAVENWFCHWWGRAFLHARIEWVGDVDDRADQPQVTDFGPAAERALERVVWHGHTIRVPPMEMQLQVSRRRGLTERALQIERMLNEKHT